MTAEDTKARSAFAAERERSMLVAGMKLLFNQNLSPKLVPRLANCIPVQAM